MSDTAPPLNTFGNGSGGGVMLIGGLPINDPQVLIGVSMLADLATELAWALCYLRVPDDYANERLIPTARRVAERGERGSLTVLNVLYPDGVPDGSPGGEILATIRSYVSGLAELEQSHRASLASH